jgi:DNA-binding GntR family transcriptional regulator
MDAAESMRRALASVAAIVSNGEQPPSLVSRIACEVGAEIVERLRAPGDDLNSVELSRRYATSRTPVREALMLLEKEGLVTVPPRRRPRVSVLDIRDVREIYRTRSALLEFIAADVARFATDEEVGRLTMIGERMGSAFAAQDFNAYLWANVDFHDLNTLLSRNRTVKRIIDSLLLRTLPLRRLSLSRAEWVSNSLDDHLYLIKAYRNRDPNLAAALLRSNHIQALNRLEGLLGAGSGAAAWVPCEGGPNLSTVTARHPVAAPPPRERRGRPRAGTEGEGATP